MSALEGTWRLAAWSASVDGAILHPYGEDADGQLHYAPSGWMYAFLHRRAWLNAPEGAAPPDMFAAYSGRWRRAGDRVFHKVAFSSQSVTIGTTLQRDIERLTDCELVLAAEIAGAAHRLAWRREA
jgi:hypothetical protein